MTRTAGDWWRVAGQVADLISDVHSTDLGDWEAPLTDLHAAVLRQTGTVAERERVAWHHELPSSTPEVVIGAVPPCRRGPFLRRIA